MSTVGAFNFEIDAQGARVIVNRTPLMGGCLSDSEVDANIQILKEDLDAVARQMKKAIREQQSQSPFGGPESA